MPKTTDPFTDDEIVEAQEMEEASPLEAVFCAGSFKIAGQLVERLFSDRFVSIRPSRKVADVSVIRPEGDSDEVLVIAHTGTQQVLIEDQDLFEIEMEEVAEELKCTYVCMGKDIAAMAFDDTVH
jgi:hypothetical protein